MSRVYPKISNQEFSKFLKSKKLGDFIAPELYLINSKTIQLFKNWEKNKKIKYILKGKMSCINCGRFGHYILIDRLISGKKMILSIDFVVMTVDHIIPRSVMKILRSQGFDKQLPNTQIMCQICNNKKGCNTSHLSEGIKSCQ